MTRPAGDWRVPLGLVALSLVPVAAGVARLAGLVTGTEVTPESSRFVASPFPVAIHIASATPYCLLGAFQFSAGIRRRWPACHRRAGRLLAGFAAAIVLAVAAILRRDVAGHEAWMIRAYALGQGAGTQVLVLGPGTLVLGEVLGLTRDLLMILAWAINLAVAERVIRRAPGPRRGAGAATAGSPLG